MSSRGAPHRLLPEPCAALCRGCHCLPAPLGAALPSWPLLIGICAASSALQSIRLLGPAGAAAPTPDWPTGMSSTRGRAPAPPRLPAVVSIGGVKVSNAAHTIAAGCAGAAVVSGIFAAESPADASRELLGVVDAALAARRNAEAA